MVPEQIGFPHFVSAAQVTRPIMLRIIQRAQAMRQALQQMNGCTQRWPTHLQDTDGEFPCHLEGRRFLLEQREASTRTFGSFGAAVQNMGGVVFANPLDNSLIKGETLLSHWEMMAGNHPAGVIVRTPEPFEPFRAAWRFESYSGTVPGKQRYGVIVNAGDGTNEHPTQAVLDLFTIYEQLGRIDDFVMLITGDLGWSRTINSLLLLIGNVCERVRIKIAVPVVGGTSYGPPATVLQRLAAAGISYTLIEIPDHATFERVVREPEIDIVYTTRPQEERYKADPTRDPKKMVADIVACTRFTLEMLNQGRVLLFHPLPHTDEVDNGCDRHPQAMYFRQASNGVPVRMALIQLIMLELEFLLAHGLLVPPFDLGWAAL